MYCPPLIWPASLWAITVPGGMIALATLFRRDARAGAATTGSTG